MQASLTSIFSLEIDPREAALRETEEAIGLVLHGSDPVELSPQNAYIRRLQHQMPSGQTSCRGRVAGSRIGAFGSTRTPRAPPGGRDDWRPVNRRRDRRERSISASRRSRERRQRWNRHRATLGTPSRSAEVIDRTSKRRY